MKKYGFIFFLISFSLVTYAQAFKTLVTNGPVAVGESFQVQYVLETANKNNEFYPPDFENFRLVAGPSTYEGMVYNADGPKKIKNIVYNLEALRQGTFIIPGARVKAENNYIKSNDVSIQVISRAEAAKRSMALNAREKNSAYFLRPGEDPYKKIRDNIFLKVMVDRKTCFVGEPVTATFKLYSRMISRSDIIKNPGFYGFTVLDVVGLNDKQVEAETINGKKFDVHTVRRVQLYPLQAGLFTIDPMEVSNKIEFSRSIVNKKAEQEIIEGVIPEDDTKGAVNTEIYKSSMQSESVTITVKPVPKKDRPDNYTGATGHFSLTALVDRTELARNEEGQLALTIGGDGNFTQLSAPVIRWPDSLEGFEPRVIDSLNNNYSPLKGNRVFHYPFISTRAGEYIIPAISFSFFDPDSAHYKTVSTQPITIVITNKEKIKKEIPGIPANETNTRNRYFIAWILAVALLVIATGLVWMTRKDKRLAPVKAAAIKLETLPGVDALLAPARLVINEDNKVFYSTCQQCAWNFFTIYLGLTGSSMNTRQLLAAMEQKGVDEKSRQDIVGVLQECETGIFAGAFIEANKNQLLQRMKDTLERIVRYV